MAAQAEGQVWLAEDLHALADLLADLSPGSTPVDHLDQLEALERIKVRRRGRPGDGRDHLRRCCRQ